MFFFFFWEKNPLGYEYVVKVLCALENLYRFLFLLKCGVYFSYGNKHFAMKNFFSENIRVKHKIW